MDSADIYAIATELKGHVELEKETLYSSVPCYAYKISNNLLKILLGDTIIDRWKIIFPLQYDGNDLSIKEQYKVHLQKNGNKKKLKVETVSYFPSHIEIEAVEDTL